MDYIPIPLPEQKKECLPFYKRFIYGFVVPLGCVWVAVRLYIAIALKPPAHGHGPAGGPGVGDILVFLLAFGIIAFVTIPLVLTCTAIMARQPWKHWYTALAGGFVGILLGIACAGIVFLIIKFFT